MFDFTAIWHDVLQYRVQIGEAIGETFMMVGISLAAAILLGFPLGTLMFLTGKGQLYEHRGWSAVLNSAVNIVRSFPFLLLVVFMIPLTRLIVGTAIGTLAASVPLAIVAVAIYSRFVEQSLLEVPRA